MQVIPAIDLRGGSAVRLIQGDYGRETIYDREPAAVARRFAAAGATRLHLVDLDGARDGKRANAEVIQAIVRAVPGMSVQLGGGIRDLESVDALLDSGIDRVVLGTVAAEQPEVLERAALRHPGRITLALDARDGRVAVRGWREASALRTEDVLARFERLPLAAVLHTDIARDGTLAGPSIAATAALAAATRHPVLASGGVGSLDDLVALARTGVIAGAIVGRALYAGSFDLESAIRVSRC